MSSLPAPPTPLPSLLQSPDSLFTATTTPCSDHITATTNPSPHPKTVHLQSRPPPRPSPFKDCYRRRRPHTAETPSPSSRRSPCSYHRYQRRRLSSPRLDQSLPPLASIRAPKS
ncbi:hypothetical protein M0R45_030314 [Rubus argutus]|uniref:Uncharacterized protein n=1 Tax=Rubus argutus TaxID=59490 RepID=A0AAW1WB48_RUBAR